MVQLMTAELQELCRRFHVLRLEVFGSATDARRFAGSDLDFLVEFQPAFGSQMRTTTSLCVWIAGVVRAAR